MDSLGTTRLHRCAWQGCIFRRNVNTYSGNMNTDSGNTGKVFTLNRNSCSFSTRIGVHIAPEYAKGNLLRVSHCIPSCCGTSKALSLNVLSTRLVVLPPLGYFSAAPNPIVNQSLEKLPLSLDQAIWGGIFHSPLQPTTNRTPIKCRKLVIIRSLLN